MVTEYEASAHRHAFVQPQHPLLLGRAIGPLVMWLALFGFLVVGGLVAQPSSRLESSLAVDAHLK